MSKKLDKYMEKLSMEKYLERKLRIAEERNKELYFKNQELLDLMATAVAHIKENYDKIDEIKDLGTGKTYYHSRFSVDYLLAILDRGSDKE